MADDAPKSALDLVLERLKRKDVESGTVGTPLTDAQRAAIADTRAQFEARAAERKIMHQATIASVGDPAERDERDAELRRDLDRFERQRDEKIKQIRDTSAG